MYRPNYHRATRQAYRTLLAAKIDGCPVDVECILRPLPRRHSWYRFRQAAR
jgi:hypothetical protein